MTERLSAQDVSFLHWEQPGTPMHVGSLSIFEPEGSALRYDTLVRLIDARLSLVPRYRQKVRWVPGWLANPVWIDDGRFDIGYHVRRSALPKPGSDAQLREFCARVMSRPLDRARPLWELYLVEGLERGRLAILEKTHNAVVDGVTSVDLGQVILDASPQPDRLPQPLWMPETEPGSAQLVRDAVRGLLVRPASLIDAARLSAADARFTARWLLGAVGGVASTARLAVTRAPTSPLNVPIGEQRRLALARTDLDDYRLVRRLRDVTVNDVVLATVAGALRDWLLSRGEPVIPQTTLRALVPVSTTSGSRASPASNDSPDGGGVGSRVVSWFVDLPVGEPNPLIRLSQVSYGMKAHAESGQAVGADSLIALSGFAPPTLLALGARASHGLTRRLYNLVVTNVPGPQVPLYLLGARLTETFPLVPLAQGQALSIGLASYDGGIYYGLNADRDTMEDVDVLAGLVEESLAELVSVASAARDVIRANTEDVQR